MRTKATPVTNIISALTARTQFGQIMQRATEKRERFLVGRRGEPKVIIMGVDDYIDAFAPTPPELAAMQTTARRTGASKLTMRQIEAEVTAVRRTTPAANSPAKPKRPRR